MAAVTSCEKRSIPLTTAATCELATMLIHLSIYAFLLEYNRLPYLTYHCISTEEGLTRELLYIYSLKLPNSNIEFGIL